MKALPLSWLRIGMIAFAPAILAIFAAAGTLVPSDPRTMSSARPKMSATQLSTPLPFDDAGAMLQPTGYRKWPHVGTPLTPNDMNNGKAAFPEFHNVYIKPGALDHYERTGEFPDGTVLVKELISVGSKQASSGKGYFMGDFIGLEVSIKDKTRFKDEPGNWAFFSFGHEYPLAAAAKPQPAANCAACHGNLAKDDYVFTQYYPALRAAKREAGSK